MFGEHHHLVSELPEYKDQIHDLKTGNARFSRLYELYNDLDNNIYRIEEGIETTADDYLENLKKQRLSLKDELFSMVKKA